MKKYLTFFKMISLAVTHVLGVSFMCLLSDCILTFTTSNGLTKNASVTPAQTPASEKVCDKLMISIKHFLYQYVKYSN